MHDARVGRVAARRCRAHGDEHMEDVTRVLNEPGLLDGRAQATLIPRAGRSSPSSRSAELVDRVRDLDASRE